jgi:hypothetical protein
LKQAVGARTLQQEAAYRADIKKSSRRPNMKQTLTTEWHIPGPKTELDFMASGTYHDVIVSQGGVAGDSKGRKV